MKRTIIFGVTALAAVSFGSFIVWSKQPSVSLPTTQQAQVKAATTQGYTTYQNDYFSMDVPSDFSTKPAQKGIGKPLYLQQLLTIPPQTASLLSDQIAVVVGLLPSGGLREVADVHMRLRSADYTPMTQANDTVIAFQTVHDSRYEISYFLQYKSYYVSIVWTTTIDRSVYANEQMKKIINSIVWQA